MGKQAAFFFGSGISYASGLPSVKEITDAALHEQWHLNTDCSFSEGPNRNPHIPDTVTPVIQEFLRKLFRIAADCKEELAHTTPAEPPHYEELFSLSEQIMRAKNDHVPNLATADFFRRVCSETAYLHIGFQGGSSGLPGLCGLADAACNFLQWVVDAKLKQNGNTREGLGLISSVAESVDLLDIFTLNHDTLVEEQLECDGIVPQMGFNDLGHGEFQVYKSGWWRDVSQTRSKVRMFKLHGSLNWWFYEFPGWARQYAIPKNGHDKSRDQNGEFRIPLSKTAEFLSGTIVKELNYNFGLWREQLEAFREHLSNHTRLICCGYGFGDNGINRRIDQWMHDRLDGSNRLVVLTEDPKEEFISNKPYWLRHLVEEDRVDFVPNYLQDCGLRDLEPHFDSL